MRAARHGEVRDPRVGGRVGGLGRNDHPRPVAQQVGVRRGVARGLPTGHRMAADEPQPVRPCSLDNGRLRARHVGDHRVRADVGRQWTCELVEQDQAGQGRRGEHDQIGPADRLAGARRWHDPVRGGQPRPRPGR
jgi:hypothetical protein